MLESGIAEPAEIAILATAVQEHCKKYRISAEADRERIATKVLALFRRGMIDPVRISTELERVR